MAGSIEDGRRLNENGKNPAENQCERIPYFKFDAERENVHFAWSLRDFLPESVDPLVPVTRKTLGKAAIAINSAGVIR